MAEFARVWEEPPQTSSANPQHSPLGDTRQLLVHLHLAVAHRNTGQIVPPRIGTQTTEMFAVLCTRPVNTPQLVQGSSEIDTRPVVGREAGVVGAEARVGLWR